MQNFINDERGMTALQLKAMDGFDVEVLRQQTPDVVKLQTAIDATLPTMLFIALIFVFSIIASLAFMVLLLGLMAKLLFTGL